MKPDTKDRISEKIDEGHGSFLRGAEQAAQTANQDQREAFEREFGGDNYEKDGTSGDLNKNLKNAEENPMGYNPGGSGKRGGFKSFLKVAKKRGPMMAVLALFGIGGTVIISLGSVGLGIVHMKEILVDDLNDQVASMDLRSKKVFKAKLKKMSSGVCSSTVKIKCKFTSMSKKQVEAFRKAGFTIEANDVAEGTFGRQKIQKMKAPDGTVINNPVDLADSHTNSVSTRSAMRRVYNSRFYGVSDAIAKKVYAKFKTSKSAKVTGKTDEERAKSVKQATSGDTATMGDGGVRTDEEGKQYVQDGDEKVYAADEPNRFNEVKESNMKFNEDIKAKPVVAGKATSSVLRNGIKGLSVIGVADTACTVYNTARAVGAAAKVARALQLAQFAVVILNTADRIKAGDATPEEVEYIGNMLTEVDTRETIVDELSILPNANDNTPLSDAQPHPNPFYKKNAFDSPGYHVAAYNDAPLLTSRSQQYMVGGGLTGSFSGVMNTITQVLGGPGGIRSTCKVVQSWWMRGIGLVGGIAASIGSFGVATAAMMAGSIAIGFATPYLESALADILAGRVIGDDIGGVDAGDAAFAGSAALMSGMAQQRGLKPLKADELESYLTLANEVKADIAVTEAYDARNEPFNIMNQYSFMGSLMRTIYPSTNKLRSGATGVATSLSSIFSTSLKSITPGANAAANSFNAERFRKTTDPGYEAIGLDAVDVFGNLRFGLSPLELSLDTEAVVDYMYSNGHIDDEGNIKSDSYKKFMKDCVDRTDGWGEVGEENGSDGSECLANGEFSYFRVYTLDASIENGMDNGPEDTTGSGDTTSADINGNAVQYYQFEEPWANQPYGHSLIGPCGCGPSTFASIVSTFNKASGGPQVTPPEMASFFVSLNGQMPSCGSYWVWEDHADDFKARYNITVESVTPSAANATRGLSEGGLIALSVGGLTPFTSGGHIMFIRGQVGENFLVGDSSSRQRSENASGFSPSSFYFGAGEGTKGMWIIKKAS